MNTRDLLLSKFSNPLTPVDVDGVTVYIRKITYSARLNLFDVSIDDSLTRDQRREAMALITKNAILHCVCNEIGDPLFTEADWPVIAADPSGAVDRLANAVLSANGATAGAQVDAGKQSPEAVTADSESGSALPSEKLPKK